jgi:hypothetical protein
MKAIEATPSGIQVLNSAPALIVELAPVRILRRREVSAEEGVFVCGRFCGCREAEVVCVQAVSFNTFKRDLVLTVVMTALPLSSMVIVKSSKDVMSFDAIMIVSASAASKSVTMSAWLPSSLL